MLVCYHVFVCFIDLDLSIDYRASVDCWNDIFDKYCKVLGVL